MKSKLLNLLLIVTSLIGYLEWGNNNSTFLFQAEADVISKMLTNPASVIHPLTILPMAGQLLLLITLFQKKPNNILTVAGIVGIGILLALMFVAGIIGLNIKIIFSVVPFLTIAFITIQHHRKLKKIRTEV